MTTAETFFCRKCDAIVRGKNSESSPGPDGATWFKGQCSVCGATVHKAVYPENGLASPQPQPPHGSKDKFGGIPERPSAVFWAVYQRAVAELLPEGMHPNTLRVASALWYNYLKKDQKLALIKEFEDTGKVTIPLEALEFQRKNPQVRQNPGKLSAESKRSIDFLTKMFWKCKVATRSVDGWRLVVETVGNPDLGECISSVIRADSIVICTLSPQFGSRAKTRTGGFRFKYEPKPPRDYLLSLWDMGLYDHWMYKSPVVNKSLVIVGVLMQLLKNAPVSALGKVSYQKGIISYSQTSVSAYSWPEPEPLELLLPGRKMPKELVKNFWVEPVVEQLEMPQEVVADIPETDLSAIQIQIDAKEQAYTAYIEKLYVDDPELARQKDLDPLAVARLMGDKEYEDLLRRRDELMWAEEQEPKLLS